MVYVLLFFIGIIVVGLSPFLIKRLTKKLTYSKSTRIVFSLTTIILFLIVASSLIMSDFDWSWSGYKSDIFLLIGLNIAFICSYVLSDFKHKSNQVFIEIILFSVILVSSIISVYNLVDFERNNVYSSKKYRIENESGFLMTANRLPYLYIKEGLFEKKMNLFYVNKGFGFHKSEMESCEIIKQENGYSVIFIMKDGSELKTSTFYPEKIEYNN